MPGRIYLRGRAPVRHVAGKMNKTEERYFQHLDLRKLAGEVAEWWFEGLTLKLANDCRFTPDFLVQLADGTLELHETKGSHMRDDALVKLKVAAVKFPFTIWLCKWLKGQWVITEVER